MTKTRLELVNEALEILRVKPLSQSAEVEDYDTVDRDVDGLSEYLSTKSIYNLDPASIEDVAFRHIATILAVRNGVKFGVPMDLALQNDAIAELRSLTVEDDRDDPIPAIYY